MKRLSAVLLAAGASRRLGRSKQLLEWQGETLVRRAAGAAIEAGVDELIVVLGDRREEVAAALQGLDVRLVDNAAWRDGMGRSIACGMQSITGDAVLLLLSDQPGVDAILLRRLIEAYRAGHFRVACAYEDCLGVPALFSDSIDLDYLRTLNADKGARSLLGADPGSVFPIEAPLVAIDIDSESDWARWLNDQADLRTSE